MRKDGRLRVVVCGTTFGRVYLNGIAGLPDEFELAGIVARGSAHAVDCAQWHGVPLYTSIADLPIEEIDMACVVVRSAVVGGAGTDLAVELLGKGVHVLQEHPIHSDDLAKCLKAARRSGRRYALNGFYPDLHSVRSFILAARQALQSGKAVYVDAACGINVLYPLVDILGSVFGGFHSWYFSPVGKEQAGNPISSVSGCVAGVPLRLGVQNTIAPEDPDNSGLLLHRISLCTENGTLMLPDTHGPVLWAPRMYVERRADGVLDMFGTSGSLEMPVLEIQEPFVERPYAGVFRDMWSEGMQRALLRFRESIISGMDDTRQNQYALTACRVWGDLGKCLGPTGIAAFKPPRAERLCRVCNV